jgi:hypothetical protein
MTGKGGISWPVGQKWLGLLRFYLDGTGKCNQKVFISAKIIYELQKLIQNENICYLDIGLMDEIVR